jgi:hypothetical protein
MTIPVRLIPLSIAAVLFALPLCAASGDSIPRPEHPRPDRYREAWKNLNGTWEFAETDEEGASFLEAEMPDRIVVPFCRESPLSGLERKGFVNYVWYRRTFEIPEDWQGKRVLFHVGACDWETTAWVNGKEVGFHRGSSDPFHFDITEALREGPNTVVLKVYDNVRTGLQPAGKQSLQLESHGIFYTRTTGIWQTVWLEAVNPTYLDNHAVTVAPDRKSVSIAVTSEGDPQGCEVGVRVLSEGAEVGHAVAPLGWNGAEVKIEIPEGRLWSLEDPFLYDLELVLLKEGEEVDRVKGYFGLRTIEIRVRAITLNGEPVFQRLVLDQGFYPEGVWTAPSDEALEGDIRLSKEAGFNGARLHQKVFEPRFLYHADRLGYLLWGEFPNFQMNFADARIDEPVIREWTEIVRRDYNHPSIIGWCPFNETPVEAARLQNIVYDLTKRLDKTRPVLDTSGWTHTYPDPDLSDAHDYNQDPESFGRKWVEYFQDPVRLPMRYGLHDILFTDRPFFVSEFGGIGWNLEEGWGYGNTPESLDAWYERFEGLCDALLDNPNMFGYCYTQLTNIEQEQNGIYNYDRTPKFDNKKLHAIQSRKAAYEETPVYAAEKEKHYDWKVLVPASHDRSPEGVWKYTFDQPGEKWFAPGFDDSAWREGRAGFGTRDEKNRGTVWESPDIWLRKSFEYDGGDFEVAYLVMFHDEDTAIHLNGEEIWSRKGWNNRYEPFEVTDEVKSSLKKGTNTLAIHTHQDHGGQYIDVGLLVGK